MGNPVWVTSLAKVKGTRSLEDLGQRSGPLEGVIPDLDARPSFASDCSAGLYGWYIGIQNRLEPKWKADAYSTMYAHVIAKELLIIELARPIFLYKQT